MSELDRLKSEWDAARARKTEAERQEHEARQAFRDARLEATGLAGHLVEIQMRRGCGSNAKTVTKRFIVKRYDGFHLEGPAVRADGTEGVQNVFAQIGDVKDLGVFGSSP